MSASVEVKIRDINEYYHLMETYKLDISAEDLQQAINLQQTWNDIVEKARYTNAKLVSVKKRFTETTKQMINSFREEMRLFNERFQESGPPACRNDLERAYAAMKLFRKQLIEYELRRADLAAAEKLFDLPISVYSDFVSVSMQMSLMEPVFTLYEQQKAARELWGETLWVDLDVQSLQDGIDKYITQLRKMPKTIKALSVHRALELNLKEFRDSLPLLTDLKHEALRERHWKKLMQQTGIVFEMRPDTFTLQSLFNMQLSSYVEVIGDILNSAVKELAIEKGMKEVEDMWNNYKFTMQKYVKGTTDRGLIIGAVDEVTVALDDNCMQLQGMASSRFIGPFLNTVQNWEQILSTISEVV